MPASQTARLKPGEFTATCNRDRWVDLAEAQRLGMVDGDDLTQRWNRSAERSEFLIRCARTFTDAEEFANHTRAVHGGGRYRWDSPTGSGAVIRNYSGPYSPTRTVRSPDAELGELVEFTDEPLGAVEQRTGSVWCKGDRPGTLWVVPDVPVELGEVNGQMGRREQAVLVHTAGGYSVDRAIVRADGHTYRGSLVKP
jgi:hypothetical protein